MRRERKASEKARVEEEILKDNGSRRKNMIERNN